MGIRYFLCLTILVVAFVSCDRCCNINSAAMPRYELIKSNARSDQSIITRRRVLTLDHCREFAASKKALAFNFGRDKNNEKTCQALHCPEVHNLANLARDRDYKYYSMYHTGIEHGTGTLVCLPTVGLFLFFENNLNYSQAQASCRKINGSLAHVISEQRTNGLARYASSDTPVFVGLSNWDEEGIWKNEFDEPLSCFEYRAWGKLEPARSRGCVGLVHPPERHATPFWKVVPCHSSLPFICEISPIIRPR